MIIYLLRLNDARSNSPGPTGLEGLGKKFFVPLSFSLLHEMADEREPSAFPGIFVAQFNQLFCGILNYPWKLFGGRGP